MFLEGHIPLVLFYPIILIVPYQLNDKKPQFRANFEIGINNVFVSRSSLTKAFLDVPVFYVKGFIFFSKVADLACIITKTQFLYKFL